jgi:phage tail-like protein
MMATEYPFTAFRFDVTLLVDNAGPLNLTNPLCNASFAECDGLEMTMEPKVVREGGDNTNQIHLVGPVTYSNLTLKRGMTENLDLWKWFTGASAGPYRGSRATGVVLMHDAAGNPTLRFTLSRCLPVKIKAAALNAKEGLIALEEVQIAYDSFTIEMAGAGNSGPGIGGGISLSTGVSAGASVNVNADLSFG